MSDADIFAGAKRPSRAERWFVTANAAVVVAALAVMAVVVGWNVSLRFLTNNSLPGQMKSRAIR